MGLLEKTKAWNERNKRPWQRRLASQGDRAFGKSSTLGRVGKQFDNAGNKMMRGGVAMTFWPIAAIFRAFKKKGVPPDEQIK